MFNFLNRFRLGIICILFIGLSFTLGVSLGKNSPSSNSDSVSGLNIINNNVASSSEQIDMAPFWEVWKLLDEKYVATKDTSTSTVITTQDRVWGAIQGMTNILGDPGPYIEDDKAAMSMFKKQYVYDIVKKQLDYRPMPGFRRIDLGTKLLADEIINDLKSEEEPPNHNPLQK